MFTNPKKFFTQGSSSRTRQLLLIGFAFCFLQITEGLKEWERVNKECTSLENKIFELLPMGETFKRGQKKTNKKRRLNLMVHLYELIYRFPVSYRHIVQGRDCSEKTIIQYDDKFIPNNIRKRCRSDLERDLKEYIARFYHLAVAHKNVLELGYTVVKYPRWCVRKCI